jgi:hypothetical protein
MNQIGHRLVAFSGGILLISSFVKFLHPAKAVAYMQFLGYTDEKLYVVAGIELIIAVVFLARPTRVFGTMLASGYLGGAIAAHLAHHPLIGTAPIIVFNYHHQYLGTIPAAVVLACAWAGTWLEQRSTDPGMHAIAQP